MTGFNPTVGSSFERAHPDDLLRRMAEVREPEVHFVNPRQQEQSSRVSTAAKTVGGTVGATVLSVGTAKVINNPEVLTNAGQTVANGASHVASGVTSVAGSILGGIQGAYGWWKWWYDWTPAPFHYGVVVAGVAIAGAAVMIPAWMLSTCYRMVRYPSGYIPVGGGGGANTNNIAFHVYNAGQVPAGCTPNFQATKDDKGNHVVQMGYVCEAPQAATIAEAYDKQAPLRAIRKKETAEEHHIKLQEYKKVELSDKLHEEITTLVEEFDEVEESKYADARVLDLISRSGPLLVRIQKELEGRDYHKRVSAIVDHQLGLLNNHTGIHDELIGIKARFDVIAKDWYGVKRQEIMEANKKAAKILLRAENEIKERNHTIVARAVHIMRKRAGGDVITDGKKAKASP